MATWVQTPGGTQWQVRRHALAWRLRFRWDLIGDDLLGLLVSPIVGLLWLPIELALLLVVSLPLTLLRALRLAGWRVTAVRDGNRAKLGWRVRGWGAAGSMAEQVRRELAAGENPSLHAHKRKLPSRAVGSGDGDSASAWNDPHWDSDGHVGGWGDGDGGGSDGGDGGCGGGGD